jgi:hypothetical protein
MKYVYAHIHVWQSMKGNRTEVIPKPTAVYTF